jgi:hypothetical protein
MLRESRAAAFASVAAVNSGLHYTRNASEDIAVGGSKITLKRAVP